MAWLCYVRSGFCAYFFIVFWINWANSSSDYHFYQGSPYQRSENLGLELIDNKDVFPPHSVHRREVPIQPPPPPPPMDNNTTLQPNTTTDELIIPHLKDAKPNKMQKLLNTTMTKVPLMKELKNLGVNGTGQRKYNSPVIAKLPTENVTIFTQTQDKGNTPKAVGTMDVDDVFSFPDNKTLQMHNITTQKFDSHIYYNSTLITDESTGHYYWVNMENRTDVKYNDLLSTSHRRAATVKLSFDFPFYGHTIKNVTIATGGFLYTGDYIHSWLAATQYIAPLMANFDTSLSNDSFIKYVDNGTAFTVEWEKVSLQDKPNEGTFTFQVTLLKSGDVVFVYQNVPLFIENIKDDHHPVKVGMSDAYIMDRQIFYVRRKTIYEYHRVNFAKEDVKNWTVIYLKALPTCLDHKDCESCTNNKLPSFNCTWCPKTRRCSNDGLDRFRQSWVTNDCGTIKVNNASVCTPEMNSESNPSASPYDATTHQDDSGVMSGEIVRPAAKMSVTAVVALMFLICMVSGMSFWILYAYRNPHTTSGQMLIRYRPSQWHWRRGEARYTAATIHM
ncbi:plexin domain-containing protein 2 [Aethina tumida]|uniref:plexin domain-containing protein 2 n=1 Tax=Aethina tumida TaxID=116153 RepID=UPI00096B0E31|nr:plexin domain-containing protein 2 [Aethina tumida]